MSSQITVTTETLRKLHRIHQQLQDLNDRLERGPRIAQAHETYLARVQAELADFQGKLKSLRIKIDDKQLQLRSREAEVERRRRQLREAKGNREYQGLLDQIAADEKASSVLEDETLEGMERLDELTKRLAAAESAVAKARVDAQKSAQELEQESPRVRHDLQRLQAELRQTEMDLPDEFQDAYRRLVRARGSEALAPIVDEFCGGCNQRAPLNVYNTLAASKPVLCRSCGRLLYLPDDGSAAR